MEIAAQVVRLVGRCDVNFRLSKGCGGVRGQGFGSVDQGEAPDSEGLARREGDQAVDV